MSSTDAALLEIDAQLLARSIVYNWRAEQAASLPNSGGVKRMPSFGEYVCRGVDIDNNDCDPEDDERGAETVKRYVKQSATEGGMLGTLPEGGLEREPSIGAEAGAEAGDTGNVETTGLEAKYEAKVETVFRGLLGLSRHYDETTQGSSMLPEEIFELSLTALIPEESDDLPPYTQYRKNIWDVVQATSCRGLEAVALTMKLTMLFLSYLGDHATCPWNPQHEAQMLKYTQDLIVFVAEHTGIPRDTSIVEAVLSKQKRDTSV